jgi:hypothetical protein
VLLVVAVVRSSDDGGTQPVGSNEDLLFPFVVFLSAKFPITDKDCFLDMDVFSPTTL